MTNERLEQVAKIVQDSLNNINGILKENPEVRLILAMYLPSGVEELDLYGTIVLKYIEHTTKQVYYTDIQRE